VISVIVPAVLLIIGSIWAYQSFSNLAKGNPELEAEIRETTLQLNAATNALVDECLKTLPSGSPSCETMKSTISEACQTASNQLDACNDGRVEQYYTIRNTASMSASSSAPIVSSSNIEETEESSSNTVQSDFRCFQRINSMIDVDENTWYGVTMYNELEGSMCERDYTGMQYGVPMKLDILRADQDIEIDPYGNDNPLYTEYRLLNGTILSFGEKEMHSS
jgi:hypothetical protein